MNERREPPREHEDRTADVPREEPLAEEQDAPLKLHGDRLEPYVPPDGEGEAKVRGDR